MVAKKYFTKEEKNTAKRKGVEAWRNKNRESVREKNRDSYYRCISTPEGHIKKNIYCIKRRAKTSGILFSMSVDDLLPFPSHCPILGIELSYCVASKRATGSSPSIDRIIPELGYVSGNVHIISNRANIIKNNASIEELVSIATYFKNME
jgi:hypothetical protein